MSTMLSKIGFEDRSGFWNLGVLTEAEFAREALPALEALLEKSKEKLNKLLVLSENEVGFENFVEEFLNHDENVSMLFGLVNHLNSTVSNDEIRGVIEKFQPKFVKYNNVLLLNEKIYQLLKAVNKNIAVLSNEQKRSIELICVAMENAGVHLNEVKKNELKSINLKLAELSEKFSNNIIDSRKIFFYRFENTESLGEMPEQDLQIASLEAQKRNLEGFVFNLSPPSYMAIMKYCTDREVRKLFFDKYNQIAIDKDFDNRPLALEILKLRKRKSEIMGLKNYVELSLKRKMAKSSEEIENLYAILKPKAKIKAESEINELRAISELQDLNLWDVSYYSRKLKEQKFNLNEKLLKEFFPLEVCLEAMFDLAEKLFDLKFERIEKTSYHADVENFVVWKGDKKVAFFVLDIFARPEKSPGAWCDVLRPKMEIAKSGENQLPIVINVANFSKGNKPSLLTHSEFTTLFHEFGHTLHMIASENTYTNTSSMAVEWDFIELPSQLLENWCWLPDFLKAYANHFKSGENIDEKTLNSLIESKNFMAAFGVLRQIELGSLDLALHQKGDFGSVDEIQNFCDSIHQQFSTFGKVDHNYLFASFSHIFAGGYASGYYSYLWAEVLEAQVFERFEKKPFDEELGRNFYEKVLAVGARKKAIKIFEDFLCTKPDPQALIKRLKFM